MREWSGVGGIFLPRSLPGLQPGLPPFNQAFCPMAPAPGIQLCLCSIILCSSLCLCKIRVVSLPLFLVSGCLDTHVYLPNQVIPWSSCQDPDDTSSSCHHLCDCYLWIVPHVSDTALFRRQVLFYK